MTIDEFLNLSYRDLEKITKIDKSNWSKYFNGKLLPNWKTIIKISDKINTSPLEAMRFIEVRKNTTLKKLVVNNNNCCVI